MKVSEFIALKEFIANNPPSQFYMGDFLIDPDEWIDPYNEEMGDYVTPNEAMDCGTAGCIAGSYALMRAERVSVGFELVNDGTHVQDFAQQGLGLTDDEVEKVFLGKWTTTPLTDITRKEALDYLDKCIEAKKIV